MLAFDWSGKPLWQTALGPSAGKNRNGSGSNPSPATDGQSLFVYFKSGTLAVLDLDGKLRWKTNLQERFGKDTLYWDIGTSPVLTEKDVVMAVMHHGDSYLAAFDKLTGEMHWKVARNYQTPDRRRPQLRHADGHPAAGQGGAAGVGREAPDRARCGRWKGALVVRRLQSASKRNWLAVASPVIAGDVAVVPYGRGNALHGIRLGGRAT